MKQLYCCYILLFSAFISLLGTSNVLSTENSASGTLTVDGTTAQISNIYFDQYSNEFTIILTDNPVAPEMIPDGIYELSEQGKVKALKFTVSRDTKQMIPRMGEAIFFHPVWDRNIDIGKPDIEITQFDENKLVGTIKTTSENEYDGHKFSYDISYSLNLKKETPKVTITGKSGPPVEAYSAYCTAIMEGNVDEFKKYMPKEDLKMMPEDQNELVIGLDFVRDTIMTDIEVLEITTNGNNAVLQMKGTRGSASADGKVTMLQEDGSWKVREESWEVR